MKTILNIKVCVLVLVFAFLTTGCKTRLTDFTILSSKNIDFAKSEQFTRGPSRVVGTDTAYIIIFIPTGSPHVKEAVDKALESVPGGVALVDGVLYAKSFWFLIGASSYVVEGTPLIDPSVQKSANVTKGKHMVSFYNHANQRQELKCIDKITYDAIKRCVSQGNEKQANDILATLN